MQRPQLKAFNSAQINDLANWKPYANDIVYWLELTLGPEESDDGDKYLVCVATRQGLESPQGQAIAPLCDRGSAIVLSTYHWPDVLAEIESRLDAAAAAEWSEVQVNLARLFLWEHPSLRQ